MRKVMALEPTWLRIDEPPDVATPDQPSQVTLHPRLDCTNRVLQRARRDGLEGHTELLLPTLTLLAVKELRFRCAKLMDRGGPRTRGILVARPSRCAYGMDDRLAPVKETPAWAGGGLIVNGSASPRWQEASLTPQSCCLRKGGMHALSGGMRRRK